MKTFEQNIINLYGEKGKQWLDNLPNLVTQLANTYELSNLKPVNNLSYNYVLSGFQGPQPIILKLGLDVNGIKCEAAALMSFEDFGVVQVFSENTGLLLLECAVPGISLKSYFPKNDDEAINITANVIKRLHKAPIPSTHAFPHIKDWLAALDGDIKFPVQTLQKAREIRDQLLKTAEPDVLLHGDLHHDNILQNCEDWLGIDPKGVIGEPAYEVAAFIRNPIPELLNHADAPNIIHNRITLFAELLELPPQRILDWCFVQVVLTWVWALEDGCDASYFEKITGIFDGMINPIKKSLQENS
ncbi:aminoglycoside phosphotransferase family protein [Orientia tsutsugamushi]|uniref:Streptomycin-6-phosphotransferase n=2 Tax=Orientia tsutsugamushi TaxID=784 RepID=A0A2U3R9C8_ORITS|nr:aminoglycoside phosphotransferase family protein [Orientia tsutsugamushi]KJV56981.1 phosphotransferase enzyme family protein [Orientia tsutsugamushi str. Kato PP]BAG40005.1 putative streptomycin-6-phosphotransferase [Orientia tsutsugamushi str. Ikeda]SPR09816.1 streptomycin-6-phosphotransferase [Orientia tsutsugamushi]